MVPPMNTNASLQAAGALSPCVKGFGPPIGSWSKFASILMTLSALPPGSGPERPDLWPLSIRQRISPGFN